MRAYFFGNMYLSSIQQGIQAAHVTAELFIKYNNSNGPKYHPLHVWAEHHKTMILLNAGYTEELHKLYGLFSESHNPYPWANFHESHEALDGVFTSIGIILPERIYDTAAIIREEKIALDLLNTSPLTMSHPEIPNDFTSWEKELIKTLNTYGMAR